MKVFDDMRQAVRRRGTAPVVNVVARMTGGAQFFDEALLMDAIDCAEKRIGQLPLVGIADELNPLERLGLTLLVKSTRA